jgi:hypothetical protein
VAEQAWILDVLDYIDAGSTALTKGTNLFANVLPDEVRTVAVGVFEQQGAAPERVYGGNDAWVKPTVQVITRTTAPIDAAPAPNPTSARNAAWATYRRLNGVANLALSTASARVATILPEHPPYLLDTDEEGRQRFSFTAGVWLTPSTGPW